MRPPELPEYTPAPGKAANAEATHVVDCQAGRGERALHRSARPAPRAPPRLAARARSSTSSSSRRTTSRSTIASRIRPRARPPKASTCCTRSSRAARRSPTARGARRRAAVRPEARRLRRLDSRHRSAARQAHRRLRRGERQPLRGHGRHDRHAGGPRTSCSPMRRPAGDAKAQALSIEQSTVGAAARRRRRRQLGPRLGHAQRRAGGPAPAARLLGRSARRW